MFALIIPSTFSFIMFIASGWQPRRTIIFCSWGGEEHGLIGSTEWTEVTLHSIFNKENSLIQPRFRILSME